VLSESPGRVRFNRVYFSIFRAKVWKILIFEWNSLLEIQKHCKNWVWKGKFSLDLNVFTLPHLEIFNSENAKNKECVHNWANDTSYTGKFLFKIGLYIVSI
jgi:hypothetical protein